MYIPDVVQFQSYVPDQHMWCGVQLPDQHMWYTVTRWTLVVYSNPIKDNGLQLPNQYLGCKVT